MGSYEYLVRLEGKIRDGIFFCVNKSDNYSVTDLSSLGGSGVRKSGYIPPWSSLARRFQRARYAIYLWSLSSVFFNLYQLLKVTLPVII